MVGSYTLFVYSIEFWTPQYRTYWMWTYGRESIEMMMLHLSEEKLRQLRMFIMENRRLRGNLVCLICVHEYLEKKEGGQTMESGSFQWCPVPGQGATCEKWNLGVCLWTAVSICLLYSWQGTNIGCPEKLWRCSKLSWTLSWAICYRGPCLGRDLN